MISRDLTFVLGGARSGKSLHAEQLANDSALPVTYIATARVADDAEFSAWVRKRAKARGGKSATLLRRARTRSGRGGG